MVNELAVWSDVNVAPRGTASQSGNFEAGTTADKVQIPFPMGGEWNRRSTLGISATQAVPDAYWQLDFGLDGVPVKELTIIGLC